MKNYISIIAASLMIVSCVDTVIIPDDKTVDEDFWKSKSDVQLMVNGAYQAMLSENVLSKLIVWGGLRSDEMIPIDNLTSDVRDDLRDINLANIQADNMYAEWGPIYGIINRCNVVLEKAAAVKDEDPSYTEGDYQADRAQMLALRALCHFYLVRNFRDVPLAVTAVMNSSQDYYLSQSAPSVVLEKCISDLKEAEGNSILATAFADWQKVGILTRDGVQSILADIFLWRASVTHSQADYDEAIAYCDKVIASKKSQHVFKRGESREEKDFYLSEGKSMFNDLFVEQNAEESIFEIQSTSTTANANMAICKYFAHYANSRDPYLFASNSYKYTGTVYTVSGYQRDWRGSMNTYADEKTVGDFTGVQIRKYVFGDRNFSPSSTDTRGNAVRAFSNTYQQNYIIYRLADVMLMKAEALVAKAALMANDATDASEYSDEVKTLINNAFVITSEVNTRAREVTTSTILPATYATIEKMEELVMAERARELAFEGKRWYDLLRFNYRHIDPVDYSTTLAAMSEQGKALATTYAPMLDFVKGKLAGKGNAVTAKMQNEAKLYMPVPLVDLNVDSNLKQNPGYGSTDTYSKK